MWQEKIFDLFEPILKFSHPIDLINPPLSLTGTLAYSITSKLSAVNHDTNVLLSSQYITRGRIKLIYDGPLL